VVLAGLGAASNVTPVHPAVAIAAGISLPLLVCSGEFTGIWPALD
jgi:hypothetical protein